MSLLPLLYASCSHYAPNRTVLPEPAVATAKAPATLVLRRPASIPPGKIAIPRPARRVLHYFHPQWKTQKATDGWSIVTGDVNGDGKADYVLQGVSKNEGLVVALLSRGDEFDLVEFPHFSPTPRRVFDVRRPGEPDPEQIEDARLKVASVHLRRPDGQAGLYYWKNNAFRFSATE